MSLDSHKELAEMAGNEVLYAKNLRIGIKVYEVMVTKKSGVAVLNVTGPDGKGYELNFENGDMRFGWVIEGKGFSGSRYIKPESIEHFMDEYHEHITQLSKSLPKEVAREILSLFTKTPEQLEVKLKDWEIKVTLSGNTSFVGDGNPY